MSNNADHINNTALFGVALAVLSGAVAAFQGKSASEVLRVTARSATSSLAGAVAHQVAVEQAEKNGLDEDVSRVAGIVAGTSVKFSTRALFDEWIPAEEEHDA